MNTDAEFERVTPQPVLDGLHAILDGMVPYGFHLGEVPRFLTTDFLTLLRLPALDDGIYTVAWNDDDYVTIRLQTRGYHSRRLQDAIARADSKNSLSCSVWRPRNFARVMGRGGTPDEHLLADTHPAIARPRRRLLRGLLALLMGLPGATIHRSKPCPLCNRPLTTPGSIRRGIGPTCEALERVQ